MAIDRGYWNQLQNAAERRWLIPPGILDRTMEIESAYRPDVISGETRSSAGAIGGLQLMPDTARRLGVDPLDPVQATEGAARLWREALDRYDGNIKLAAADYNMGAPGVAAVLRGEREFPEETVNYMARFDDFLPASATALPARPPAPANAPPARPIPLQPQQQPQQQPPSIDDMLMTELTRRPEPRQNNVFDFMGQLAPLVAATMGSPQMASVTSLVAKQLGDARQQEVDREEAYQDRLLQLAVLRGKENRPGTQTRDIQEYNLYRQQTQNPMNFDEYLAWKNSLGRSTGSGWETRTVDGRLYRVNPTSGQTEELVGASPDQGETGPDGQRDPNRVYFGAKARNDMEAEILNSRNMLARLTRMNEAWDPELYRAGAGTAQWASNLGTRFGIDPSEYVKRKNEYDSYLEELAGIIRNERFGAALTEGEKASARRFLPDPNDPPDKIATNLAKLSELFQEVETRLFNDLNRGYLQREQREPLGFSGVAPAPAPSMNNLPYTESEGRGLPPTGENAVTLPGGGLDLGGVEPAQPLIPQGVSPDVHNAIMGR